MSAANSAGSYLAEALRDGVGSIHLITGPMFAKKTTTLADVLEWASLAKKPSCYVRHGIDERGEGEGTVLRTHEGLVFGRRIITEESGIHLARGTKLSEVKVPPECKIVTIDEGQFFPDLADGCMKLAAVGCVVFVAALNGDAFQKPWVPVTELVPHLTTTQMCHAWCAACNDRPAAFTVRGAGYTPDPGVGQTDPGGADKFQPVCRKCLLARSFAATVACIEDATPA